MLIRGQTPASCFGLAGCDENAGTAAFGWCLDQCPSLRRELLTMLDMDPELELVVASQVFADDRGFTDLELTAGTTLHAIVEAKLGWRVPTQGQLERYLPRLLASSAQHRRLVSVSAASSNWSARHQPREIGGVPLQHMAWSDLQSAARRAHDRSRSPIERAWLSQLIEHLKGYGMTSNLFDTMSYVVSLSTARVRPENPLTWIDVVAEQGKYFHPVGGNGWPVIPPAYIGFRYQGKFRSVHFIESVQVSDHLHEVDPRWPITDAPHFVYTLGPPMCPAEPMPLGKIHYNMRNWVALDLLLSGKARDYKEAIALTKERQKMQGD